MSAPQANFSPFEQMMEAAGAASAIPSFRHSYEALSRGETGQIAESTIDPVSDLPSLSPGPKADAALLSQTCILKLNGGLGTSMGLDRAKSLLPVKEGLTFLDLISRHVLGMRQGGQAGPSFLFMNSFNTSADTREYVTARYPELGKWEEMELMQNKVPKVDAATLAPVAEAGPLAWCPPGHGDLYAALAGSGKLDSLLNKNVRYLFVSNADNLGATLDPTLLRHFADSGAPFLMEVTERTEADRKGGHLCRDSASGQLRLREVAQCPKEDQESFSDIGKHRFFNTNNLWIDLEQLKKALKEGGGLIPLPTIFNRKTVDPRDPTSTQVVQLETAMGAAIESFPGAAAIVVPRTRFLPVKTTNDLLTLRSDAYVLEENAALRLVPEAAPLVDLDKHYKMIDDFEGYFPEGAPSLRDCNRLTVKGPVLFEKGVKFNGDVTVFNRSTKTENLAAGTYAGEITAG